MTTTQSFRLTETKDTTELGITHVDGQTTVSWGDIEQAFPGVKQIRGGNSVIKFHRGSSQQSPVVIDVVLTTSIEHVGANSSKIVPTGGVKYRLLDAAADKVFDALKASQQTSARLYQETSTHTSRKASESEVQQRFISLLDPKVQETVRSSPNIYQAYGKAIHHTHVETSQDELSAEPDGLLLQKIEAMFVAKIAELQETITAKQEEIQAIITSNAAVINTKQDEIKQLQQEALDNQEKMKEMQKKTLEQLAVLQSRVQAVLTQTYELHEYPIPRLFVVLPQDLSVWDTFSPFANKFRLYFLCECGEHTKSTNSKTGIPHHIHFAKHEGYEIARPSEFFEQYGSYVLTILKMLKYSITVAGIVMPSFSQLINPDVLGQSITSLKLLQDTIVPGMDQVIGMVDSLSDDPIEGIEGVSGQVESKEALEGADLRKLETFLRAKDGNKVLGDLYRTVTDEGHVKWVCIDHYRDNYDRTSVETFRRAVESLGGSFDEKNGLVKVDLGSRAAAKQFYMALGYARSVLELNIILDWDCTATDLQLLDNALTTSAVISLHLDLQRFQPSLTDKLSSLPTRYQALSRIFNIPNMTSIHIVLPKSLIKLSNFSPKRPPHLRKLSFEMVIALGIRIHAEMLETGSTVNTLYRRINTGSIESSEVQALSETLRNNSILTTLNLYGNSIGANGAQALSEALKTNSTLTTLDLYGNSIGDDGVRALSEALKTNLTLTTLDLYGNSIGDDGAQALSEALKTNSTLTTLTLTRNTIGASGAQALSEALKTNSTLTTLILECNSIGDKGPQALSEALKTNATLTTLNLMGNSIGGNGAQALSEALKTNSTLTTLILKKNTIRDNGVQALSGALESNLTLTTLKLQNNSIGDRGAKALSLALKINSTLTTLDLEENFVGENGAQALFEALKTNSTLTSLGLGGNSIGARTRKALLDTLKRTRREG
ncbi:hypothetical protein BGZ70_000672 [Mortierella alpina]|uniref:RNI-like protein n=1 Tax=Mortierella alpina TaxID=64518 RepID=A0A9P6IXF2_MORAP|nr:hypothetical protein BGZ70_000672 [Mortierella alpina]